MKKLLVVVCLCMVAIMMVTSAAYSEELWDWHLRGADEGLASGAVVPPGLYFVNDFYWTGNWKLYNNAGQNNTGVKLQGYVDVPILLWNPGICPILGATYACGIAQPFDVATIRAVGTSLNGTQWGAYNTVLIPFILSWQIPCNLHVAASFAVGLNDGTSSPGNSLASVTKQYSDKLNGIDGGLYAWSSSDAYTFTPTLGISWLYGGWNISAEFMYTVWTKDTDCDIQNGDQFAADYTLTYTSGKWTFGLGAEQENQVYNDKGNVLLPSGALSYQTIPDSCNVNYTMGPIIGYNFGPCSLLFTYNFEIQTKNDVGGDWAMLRLVVPLGNPYSWLK